MDAQVQLPDCTRVQFHIAEPAVTPIVLLRKPAHGAWDTVDQPFGQII